MKYERLIELCENLTVANYREFDDLVNELFDKHEILLIRKNARLGFVDEVRFIKSQASYKKLKSESNNSRNLTLKFNTTHKELLDEIDVLFGGAFNKSRGENK